MSVGEKSNTELDRGGGFGKSNDSRCSGAVVGLWEQRQTKEIPIVILWPEYMCTTQVFENCRKCLVVGLHLPEP